MSCRILPDFTKGLKTDPTGMLHLGKDGVFRSLSKDLEVIDAVALTWEQYKQVLEAVGSLSQYTGGPVDGTKLPQSEWYHPQPGVLLPKMDE
ncbi:hypothetical protein ISF_05657 [Cordyceps fumosorosea ARSEF 2679]|uniref:Uncharacterized protein n=1 Tax=Cordyceps fumosorosea (strain ARSEF 2679) TaxID=1081104 RepID=A0A167UHE3_CORFA|nr:hypothetical protein ISF_05657 [Cordyceps fumosorosea ARSEF 2679]OAA61578.1 hypothetical protein ISF_05657 [Cordyceps fumosorosea ARSEF 2679]